MEDIVIIGGGPAGLSAALYTLRGGYSTTVIGKDGGALWRAAKVENYFAAPGQPSGKELVEKGRAQAIELGAVFLEEEVTALAWQEHFMITTTARELEARSVIIATGSSRAVQPIPGMKELEGKGVSFCAVCDAFFFRGSEVAVLGGGAYALHEVEYLLPLMKKVTVLTNGTAPEVSFPEQADVVEAPVRRLLGETVLEGVELENGTSIPLKGLFVAMGSAGGPELARKLGLPTEGNKISVDESMATMIPGLFAAGDCASKIQQASVAVGQGAAAGLSAVRYLNTLK